MISKNGRLWRRVAKLDGMLSVVIPCYNAEKNIENVINNNIKIFAEQGFDNYEFVLVNDCSKDNTWAVINRLACVYNNITAVNLAKNAGQHGAIMAGFNNVLGDYIVVSDDDGQTQMERISELFAKMDEGYDVVSTRWVSKAKRSLIRRLGTNLNDAVTRMLFNQPKEVYLSIFFLAKRFIVDEIIKYDNPYPYILGLVVRCTNNIGVVDVEQLERQNGNSGYSLRKLIRLWLNGFTSFSIVPLRLSTYLGFGSAFTGFIYGLVIIMQKLLKVNVFAGWSSIMALILIIGGIILCVLGMIGEYVGRIYMCINNTPQYVVKEIVKK